VNPVRVAHLPRVPPAAWHGAIGEAVREIAPVTEADPVGILVQVLALFGALVGDVPHVKVGGVPHPARIWPLLIGTTSWGRKGTGLGDAKHFVSEWSSYSATYLRHRLHSGLSSGEGLLAALGAARVVEGRGKPAEEAPEPIAPDGKLTVTEAEFTRALAASKREGNTLGQVLRELWDSGHAGIMTRSAPLMVNDAHLTVLGHVVPEELRSHLSKGDVLGGTANRLLFCAVERPHLRPDDMEWPDLAKPARWLGEQVEAARLGVRQVRKDRQATELWREIYSALNDDEAPGVLGAVLARGPAYTMRLALVYALADGAGAISTEHLLAGLSVWHYAAQSAQLIFADSRRRDDHHRLAEYIASAGGGRTATEIFRLFGGNKSSAELRTLVDELERRGDVTVETQGSTGGRPVTRIWWTGAPRDAVGELLSRYEKHVNT
jgi:hypothetical protein